MKISSNHIGKDLEKRYLFDFREFVIKKGDRP